MSSNKVEFALVQSMISSLSFKYARIGDTTTTVCEAFLPNGFSVGSGKSACVDPANFDFEVGCKFARENAEADAKNTIWMLEGYLLKVTGYTSDCTGFYKADGVAATSTPFQRLHDEKRELARKLEGLSNLLVKPQPDFIDDVNWELLKTQHLQMSAYFDTLDTRLKTFNVKDC